MAQALSMLAVEVDEFASRRTRNTERYPAELRGRVARVAARALASGMTVRTVSRRVGVRPTTLRRWLELDPPARMRPAVMVDEAVITSSAVPVLVSPSGWRVEGLSLADLRTLLS